MKHKAILINVKERSISEVEVEDSVDEYNRLIGSDCYTCGPRLPNLDGVLVDDNGLLNIDNDTMFFTFGKYPQPLAGNGLILGCSRSGETVNVKSKLEDIKKIIKFHTLSEVRTMF